jgi:hypothetical protein
VAQLLFKVTLDFATVRVRDLPLSLTPHALIVGIDDGSSNREILDSAYLIQYPFIDGFGYVKGEYFRLSSGFNLLLFDVQLPSKFRLLPLRKQPQITISLWKTPMPIYPDQSNQSATSGTTTTVPASITSVSLLAANSNRKGASIYNNSPAATLYIGFGPTATTTNYADKIGPNSLWEMPIDYDGQITGIWSLANGSAQVTEFV